VILNDFNLLRNKFTIRFEFYRMCITDNTVIFRVNEHNFSFNKFNGFNDIHFKRVEL